MHSVMCILPDTSFLSIQNCMFSVEVDTCLDVCYSNTSWSDHYYQWWSQNEKRATRYLGLLKHRTVVMDWRTADTKLTHGSRIKAVCQLYVGCMSDKWESHERHMKATRESQESRIKEARINYRPKIMILLFLQASNFIPFGPLGMIVRHFKRVSTECR